MIEQPFSELTRTSGTFILAGQHGKRAVTNPVDGAHLQSVPWGDCASVKQAIAECKRGLKVEKRVSQRAEMLQRIAEQLILNRQELARIINAENGKPIEEAASEVDYAIGFFRFYSEHVVTLSDRRLRAQPRGHEWTIRYRPSGIAGLIVPWNFPLAMLAKKLAAAIAGGTPCVIKPAEQTPLASLALMHLLEDTAVPNAWVRWVLGDASMIGKLLCRDSAVRYISFTGSTRVGKILLQQTTERCKRLTLELGGNAPLIVCADANLERVVEHVMLNKFRCAGQTCVCINRIYAHRSIMEELSERLVARVTASGMVSSCEAGKSIGIPQIGTRIGPLINRTGYMKVARHVEDALAGGGRLLLGGVPTQPPGQDYGCFFPPTIVVDVDANALCTREETFGPFVPIISFEKDHQALRWANRTEFGLAAYLFSSSESRTRKFLGRLQFGHIGLNSATGPTPEAPFGGMKQSGFGREGGRDGLYEFVESQVIARDRHIPMS